jgi:hypothetical protein
MERSAMPGAGLPAAMLSFAALRRACASTSRLRASLSAALSAFMRAPA